MARRRRKKGPDVLEIALACGSLVGLVAIVDPSIQGAIVQLGTVLLWVAIFVVIFATLLGVASVIKGAKETPEAVAKHESKAAEPPTSTPNVIDDSRYMPKEPAACQQHDPRYMPKEMVLANDDAPYKPKPQKSLAQQIHAIDWFQFEKLIELAYAPTHKVTRRGGAKADGGIDVIIEDASGQTAVQCKHWKSWKVGVRNVRELMGAMTDAGLKKGTLVTIKGYSADAAELAARHNIELVDEAKVLMLLENADAVAVNAILNDHRKFCPRCEKEMVLRTPRKGDNAGGRFWGCTEYPKCHQTLPFETVS